MQIFYVSILFPFVLPFYFLTITTDIDTGISRKLPTITKEKNLSVPTCSDCGERYNTYKECSRSPIFIDYENHVCKKKTSQNAKTKILRQGK